jgi:hypothetical protein
VFDAVGTVEDLVRDLRSHPATVDVPELAILLPCGLFSVSHPFLALLRKNRPCLSIFAKRSFWLVPLPFSAPLAESRTIEAANSSFVTMMPRHGAPAATRRRQRRKSERTRADSSVGRALALQAGCRRFKSSAHEKSGVGRSRRTTSTPASASVPRKAGVYSGFRSRMTYRLARIPRHPEDEASDDRLGPGAMNDKGEGRGQVLSNELPGLLFSVFRVEMRRAEPFPPAPLGATVRERGRRWSKRRFSTSSRGCASAAQ